MPLYTAVTCIGLSSKSKENSAQHISGYITFVLPTSDSLATFFIIVHNFVSTFCAKLISTRRRSLWPLTLCEPYNFRVGQARVSLLRVSFLTKYDLQSILVAERKAKNQLDKKTDHGGKRCDA